jgi:hypothetical protein
MGIGNSEIGKWEFAFAFPYCLSGYLFLFFSSFFFFHLAFFPIAPRGLAARIKL